MAGASGSWRVAAAASGALAEAPRRVWEEAARLLQHAQRQVREELPHDERLETLQRNEHEWLLPLLAWLLGPGAGQVEALVDLGPGQGTLMTAARLMGLRVAGVDREPCCGESLREAVLRADILDGRRVARWLVEQIGPAISLIACTQVLEHLPYSPRPAFLWYVAALDAPYLYLSAARPAFQERWPLGGVAWRELPVWRGEEYVDQHWRPWEPEELAELCADLGYETVGAVEHRHRAAVLAKRRGGEAPW